MEINGYPNYLIFKNGSILSKAEHRLNNTFSNRPRFMKHVNHPTGYKTIRLFNDGKGKNYRIHKLLAEHFIPNPENKPSVDHINRIKTDNRLCNLRWATMSEQRKNQRTLRKSNTSGHKNVSYGNRDKKWIYVKKINDKKVRKTFKSKIDALCYKYIILLRIKANHYP